MENIYERRDLLRVDPDKPDPGGLSRVQAVNPAGFGHGIRIHPMTIRIQLAYVGDP